MRHYHLCLFVFSISLLCLALSAEARRHHSRHKHSPHHHKGSNHSQPPSVSPTPEPSPEPVPEPGPEPAEPPYNDDDPTNSSGVFDVRRFGAAGDGVTDDTEAFKMVWDAGCQAESASVILVPKGFSFMIQSTIFTGPCKQGIVFQVMLLLLSQI